MTLKELIDQAYEINCSITLEQKEKLEKDLNDLNQSQLTLNALECAGVDNWDGYGFALEQLE